MPKLQKKPPKKSFNSLKGDPTRTGMLRERFVEEFKRRYNIVGREVVKLLVDEDAFGLKQGDRITLPTSFNNQALVANTRWRFLSSNSKVVAFQNWLKARLGLVVKEEYKDNEDAYWQKYVDEGYKKGAGRAFDDARKVGKYGGKESMDFYAGTKAEFMRSSFGPESVDKVKLLAGRVLTDLHNVNEDLAAKMSRTLTDGLVQGQNPRLIADNMVIDLGIAKNRASTIARTEIIRAHAEGQLDAFDKLGVTEIGVAVEWATAADARVCPLCQPLEGIVYSIKEAHGLLPRHPNCRCAFLPANVGEISSEQVRTKAAVQAAMTKSIKREVGSKLPIDAAKKLSTWTGADTNVSKVRPKALVDALKPVKKVYKAEQVKGLKYTGAKHELTQTTVNAEAKRLSEQFPGVATDLENAAQSVNLVNKLELTEGGAVGTYNPKSGVIRLSTLNTTPAKQAPTLGGWSVGEDIGSTFRHEYGHRYYDKMFDEQDLLNWETLADKYADSKVVSIYAKTNEKELFAESFSAFTHKGYKPGSLPSDIEDFLKVRLAKTKVPIPVGKPGGPLLSLPTELKAGGTPEEWKQFGQLVSKRAKLNATIKAGTATPEQVAEAEQLIGDIAAMRKLLKARTDLIKQGKTLEEAIQEIPDVSAVSVVPKGKVPKPLPKPTVAPPEPLPTIPPTPAPVVPKPTGKAVLTDTGLPTRDSVTVVQSLPGSTNPKLVVDPSGKKWVMKEGLNKAHVESEALADELYRILGVKVPKSGIVEHAGKPIKFAEFIEDGETLGKYLTRATTVEQEAVKKALQENFVADALLGNWDVAGLSMDNILVVKGVPIRIDNGGSLLYRAQGGLKQGWGARVDELTSLLDPSANAQTAQIFKGITQKQIDTQALKIVLNKEKVLAAIPDAKLRSVMEERINWLEERISKQQPAKVVREVAESVVKVDKKFVEAVKESRVNGKFLPGDREDIEDLGMLVWEEIDETGKPVTRLRGKVTEKGAVKLRENMKDSLEVMQGYNGMSVQADPTVHQADIFWDQFLAAAKTVNHHQADGAYNPTTVAAFKKKLDTLKILAKNMPDGNDAKPMADYYMSLASDIEKAMETQTTVGVISRYRLPQQATKGQGARVASRVADNRLPTAELVNGRAKRTYSSNEFSGKHLVMSFDEAEVRYFPTGGSGHLSGRAFENTVDIQLSGEASVENIEKGKDIMRQMGIDMTPPSREYQELVYLHKGIRLQKKDNLVAYKKIIDDESLSDAKKVEKVKAWVKKTLDIDLANAKYYNPEGVTGTSYGDGYRYWNRWDLPPEEVEEKMSDYVLHHNTSVSTETVIEGMLQSGGEATSTVERIRKGVNLNATGGMSSQQDIMTGGADFFFTRIKRKSYAERTSGITFKIRNLARQDAVSYRSDKYGSMDALNERKTDGAGFIDNSGGSSNETIFKHGLSLIDEVDKIIVNSETSRKKIIAIFHKNKIKELPDGRLIEDVVKAH